MVRSFVQQSQPHSLSTRDLCSKPSLALPEELMKCRLPAWLTFNTSLRLWLAADSPKLRFWNLFRRFQTVTSARFSEQLQTALSFRYFLGVREALDAISRNPHYLCGMLTGNFESTAHFKINLAGLSEHFNVPGAFRDQSFHRRDLLRLAAGRISSHLGLDLQPSQFIVIGDTPDDIACARHFGARAIAVATSFAHR